MADPEKGTLRLFIPDAAKENIRARATAPGAMPVERELKPSKEKGVYQLPFPIKPGETRFDVSYKMAVKEPITFASRILHPEGQVFVLVPPGVEVESADLTPRGQEPTTKANAYEVKNRQYSLKLTGTGALRGSGEDNNAQDDDTPRITQIDPRIYDRLIPILALSLVVLALGFFALYRRT